MVEKPLGVTKMSYSANIFIKSCMVDGRMHPSLTSLYSKYCRCEMQQRCINLRLIMGIKMST